MIIRIKRAYEEAAPTDGTRILVERLWPRGVRRERAAIDHWPKDIAPSTALRTWYAHVPERWPEFQTRYRKELDANRDMVETLVALIESAEVTTFVFAARDVERNSAVVLRAYVEGR